MLVPLSCGDFSREILVEEMFRQGEVGFLHQQIQPKTGCENFLAMCVGQWNSLHGVNLIRFWLLIPSLLYLCCVSRSFVRIMTSWWVWHSRLLCQVRVVQKKELMLSLVTQNAVTNVEIHSVYCSVCCRTVFCTTSRSSQLILHSSECEVNSSAWLQLQHKSVIYKLKL